ncbi:MAG: D-2-hydroxyacid dehydrogenase [Campylobacterota bacterium]|nr:D-2-hydroxyacid dehydrogenase [Campylobacterota bacterium]
MSKRIVFLDAITLGDISLDSFNKFGDVVIHQKTSKDETLERVKDANIVVTNKVVMSDEIISTCSSLELICVAATGMNNIDLNSASKHGVEVKNVAGYSTASVVQHTFSMLFYLTGSSSYYDNYVSSGSYSKSDIFTNLERPYHEISGKKYGIIGLGEIGKSVANVALAFGAEICYYSTSGKNSDSNYKRVELDELLQTCDIISIHSPLNEKTKNLIDINELRMLKNGATLLNLGRGGIVNESAMAQVIDEKNICIGLDVLEVEPMTQNHPLLHVEAKERLYITPHIAWASIEAREKLVKLLEKNITTSLNG